jgi:hypothetical protein
MRGRFPRQLNREWGFIGGAVSRSPRAIRNRAPASPFVLDVLLLASRGEVDGFVVMRSRLTHFWREPTTLPDNSLSGPFSRWLLFSLLL